MHSCMVRSIFSYKYMVICYVVAESFIKQQIISQAHEAVRPLSYGGWLNPRMGCPRRCMMADRD
jgi:hypothetical protein